ncbi:hypothetical protein ACP4OV_022397 [Aristida adscensionis]
MGLKPLSLYDLPSSPELSLGSGDCGGLDDPGSPSFVGSSDAEDKGSMAGWKRPAPHHTDDEGPGAGNHGALSAFARPATKPFSGMAPPPMDVPDVMTNVEVDQGQEGAAGQQELQKITVAINPLLLQCCVCFGPLDGPVFQCTRGHISCSACCTDNKTLQHECLMCRVPEKATRCRAMERVLGGIAVPCAFRASGCAAAVPYAERQAHAASCAYAPRHCPVAGCAGYGGAATLRDHLLLAHPELRRVRVARTGRLSALKMHAAEAARVVRLGGGDGAGGRRAADFLLVVGRHVPSGRALSVVRLADPGDDDEFKYRIEVMVGDAGVLSLASQAVGVERLSAPYQPRAFLFVPDAVWESPGDVPVFIELK